MTLPVYPNAISLGGISTEFTGVTPSAGSNISFNALHAGSGIVPSGTIGYPHGTATAIPSGSGTTVSFDNFHGAANRLFVRLTSGTSYVAPAGYTTMEVIIVGGGGGGGSTAGNASYADGGGGGGAGGLVRYTFNLDPANRTYTYTIGGGGAGGDGTGINGAGQTGANTNFQGRETTLGPGMLYLLTAFGGGGGGGSLLTQASYFDGKTWTPDVYEGNGKDGGSGGGASAFYGGGYSVAYSTNIHWFPGLGFSGTQGTQGNRGGYQYDNGTNGSGGGYTSAGGDWGQGTGGIGYAFSYSGTTYQMAGGGGAGGGFSNSPNDASLVGTRLGYLQTTSPPGIPPAGKPGATSAGFYGPYPSTIYGSGKLAATYGGGGAGGNGQGVTGNNGLPGVGGTTNTGGGGGGGGGGPFYGTIATAIGGNGGSGVIYIGFPNLNGMITVLT